MCWACGALAMLVGRLVWGLRKRLVWDLCGACAALAQGLVWDLWAACIVRWGSVRKNMCIVCMCGQARGE